MILPIMSMTIQFN